VVGQNLVKEIDSRFVLAHLEVSDRAVDIAVDHDPEGFRVVEELAELESLLLLDLEQVQDFDPCLRDFEVFFPLQLLSCLFTVHLSFFEQIWGDVDEVKGVALYSV